MKLFQTLIAAGVLAVPGTVLAAPSTSTLSVHVPFAFTLAGQEFTAGDYQVRQDDNGVICVQGSRKAAMVITVPGTPTRPGAASALQFETREAHEQLVGVQVEGAELRLIPSGQSERKMALTSAQ